MTNKNIDITMTQSVILKHWYDTRTLEYFAKNKKHRAVMVIDLNNTTKKHCNLMTRLHVNSLPGSVWHLHFYKEERWVF